MLGWSTCGLRFFQTSSTQKALFREYAEVLRMIRNLIHPGRYIREHSPARLTAKHLEKSFEILEICTEHLYCKLEDSIRKQLDHRPKRLKGLQRPGKLNRNATKETAKSDRKRRALEQES